MRISPGQQKEIARTQADFAPGAKPDKTLTAEDQVKWQGSRRNRRVIDGKRALQPAAQVQRRTKPSKFDEAT